LHLGDEQHVVVPEQLSDVWFGRFVAMWQTPPGYHGSLREGDEHSSVGWLRAQLANIVAIAPSPVANRFDSSLYDAVTAFQRREGLVTDGVVGPDTWIRLADRSTQTTPKLEQ
jgi:general secretion pathway protein A